MDGEYQLMQIQSDINPFSCSVFNNKGVITSSIICVVHNNSTE